MIFQAADLVGNAVIAYVHQNEQIYSTDGFKNPALGFPGAEAGTFTADEKRFLGISVNIRLVRIAQQQIPAELHEILVNSAGQGFAAFEGAYL